MHRTVSPIANELRRRRPDDALLRPVKDRAATSAPMPIARPRSKGTRLASSPIAAPKANHSDATRVARAGKAPSSSLVNSAVARVIETAASSCTPISAPSAGASSE